MTEEFQISLLPSSADGDELEEVETEIIMSDDAPPPPEQPESRSYSDNVELQEQTRSRTTYSEVIEIPVPESRTYSAPIDRFAPPERPNILDYGKTLNVQGDLVGVVHGHLSPPPPYSDSKDPAGPQPEINTTTDLDEGAGDPATLVVTEFRFTSLTPPRRFRHAMIIFNFAVEDDDGSGNTIPPEVVKIAPQGVFAMNRTEKQQEIHRGANASVGGNLAAAANASVGFEWGLTESRTKHEQASLSGLRTSLAKDGPATKNAACWSMTENKHDERGVPNVLRLAILLRRRSDRRFLGNVRVNTKVDLRYKIETRGGNIIDPVVFDPKGGTMVRGRKFLKDVDPDNLDLVDLDKLMLIQSEAAVLS